MGVTNNEGSTVNYTMQVDLVRITAVINVTSGLNETIDTNRSTLSWTNFTLASQGTWREAYSFSIKTIGTWEVQFILYADNEFSGAYREVHLYITVT